MLSNRQGFSLIEMLIVLSIFSLVLLSVSYQQSRNTQWVTHLYFEEVALNLMHNAYEQLEAQDSNANQTLQQEAAYGLPQGEGQLVNSPTVLSIEVTWVNRFSLDRNVVHMEVSL